MTVLFHWWKTRRIPSTTQFLYEASMSSEKRSIRLYYIDGGHVFKRLESVNHEASMRGGEDKPTTLH
jgi:hypothetical protein